VKNEYMKWIYERSYILIFGATLWNFEHLMGIEKSYLSIYVSLLENVSSLMLQKTFYNVLIRQRANLELICTSEFFKKLKIHEQLRWVQHTLFQTNMGLYGAFSDQKCSKTKPFGAAALAHSETRVLAWLFIMTIPGGRQNCQKCI